MRQTNATRPKFAMTRPLTLVLTMVLLCSVRIGAEEIIPEKIPNEVRAEQIQEMKWGMFTCWSFSTFAGQEWTPTRGKDAAFFKATGVDADQWARTAKEAGMGYILFLAKHHDGFCLWDTDTTDLKVTNSPLGVDVLAELRKSCDKYGIKLALYFSEGDWTWPGAVDGKRNGGHNPEMKKAQLKELTTRYGPIEFWWMNSHTRSCPSKAAAEAPTGSIRCRGMTNSLIPLKRYSRITRAP